MVSMTIDHIGAVIFARLLMAAGLGELNQTNSEMITEWLAANADIYGIYMALRTIGRIAFPIFCFLLVEGFLHTSNAKRYAMRLFAFALISEIPFDLAFQSKWFGFGYQNVFFTLAIGCIAMIGLQWVEEKQEESPVKRAILQMLIVAAGLIGAELLRTDYAAMGVFAIVMLYYFRNNKFYQVIAGCLAFMDEIPAMLAFLPIILYNGKRGLKVKYGFYAFYPLHLLILFAVCCFMGLAGYAVI